MYFSPTALDGYGDGMGLYANYFSPNTTDPSGMKTFECWQVRSMPNIHTVGGKFMFMVTFLIECIPACVDCEPKDIIIQQTINPEGKQMPPPFGPNPEPHLDAGGDDMRKHSGGIFNPLNEQTRNTQISYVDAPNGAQSFKMKACAICKGMTLSCTEFTFTTMTGVITR